MTPASSSGTPSSDPPSSSSSPDPASAPLPGPAAGGGGGQASVLRLYSRQGCCLCEGLEERLRALVPPPSLEVVDVDGDPALQARYGLRVPVLALPPVPLEPVAPAAPAPAWRDLPPVPPRMAGERLQAWLAGFGMGRVPGPVGGGAVAGAAAPAGTLPPSRL